MGHAFLQLRSQLEALPLQDQRPVVCYTGIWSIAQAFEGSRADLAPAVLAEITRIVGSSRTLIMPTYTGGFKAGAIDLDHEPGNTGMVNELLRAQPDVKRTASAFFSFAAKGPDAKLLYDLRPQDAWGDGSVFDWIDKKNAHIILIGVPHQMCSFLHRVEWITQVPYRYLKSFEGTMVRDGQSSKLTERLFVRSLDPAVENDFPSAEGRLRDFGLQSRDLGRGQVSHIHAQDLVKALVPVLESDPFAYVKDAEKIRHHWRNKP